MSCLVWQCLSLTLACKINISFHDLHKKLFLRGFAFPFDGVWREWKKFSARARWDEGEGKKKVFASSAQLTKTGKKFNLIFLIFTSQVFLVSLRVWVDGVTKTTMKAFFLPDGWSGGQRESCKSQISAAASVIHFSPLSFRFADAARGSFEKACGKLFHSVTEINKLFSVFTALACLVFCPATCWRQKSSSTIWFDSVMKQFLYVWQSFRSMTASGTLGRRADSKRTKTVTTHAEAFFLPSRVNFSSHPPQPCPLFSFFSLYDFLLHINLGTAVARVSERANGTFGCRL